MRFWPEQDVHCIYIHTVESLLYTKTPLNHSAVSWLETLYCRNRAVYNMYIPVFEEVHDSLDAFHSWYTRKKWYLVSEDGRCCPSHFISHRGRRGVICCSCGICPAITRVCYEKWGNKISVCIHAWLWGGLPSPGRCVSIVMLCILLWPRDTFAKSSPTVTQHQMLFRSFTVPGCMSIPSDAQAMMVYGWVPYSSP